MMPWLYFIVKTALTCRQHNGIDVCEKCRERARIDEGFLVGRLKRKRLTRHRGRFDHLVVPIRKAELEISHQVPQ
jgi:hypothetical protein